MLTRLLRGALESKLEYGRPTEPELICTCHETIKIVGENPDNHYLGASLDGKYDYRIWGTRGEAKWISFNLFSGAGFGGGGPGTGATLHEEQMHIEPDGTLRADHLPARAPGELAALRGRHPVASPSARRSSTSATRQHAELHIERIDDDGTPPDAARRPRSSTSSLIYAGLLREGRRRDRRRSGRPASRSGPTCSPTRPSWPRPTSSRTRRSSGTRRYFDLADDEALVVEVTPPECEYWMIALHNHWMETLDYVHHQATLNCHSAQLEPDGSVRFVDRPPRSRASPTGSTPPATGAAPSACAGSAPTSSTSSPPPGS